MICYRNARIIDSDCPMCKDDALAFNQWRESGGLLPEYQCTVDHRPVCEGCGQRSDDLKKCSNCKRKV